MVGVVVDGKLHSRNYRLHLLLLSQSKYQSITHDDLLLLAFQEGIYIYNIEIINTARMNHRKNTKMQLTGNTTRNTNHKEQFHKHNGHEAIEDIIIRRNNARNIS